MTAFDKLVAYLRSSKEEVKKVSWPSRQDTIRYSALVIGASICVAVFFAALDSGFTLAVNAILSRRSQPSIVQPQEVPITPDQTATSGTKSQINFDTAQPITTPTTSTPAKK